MTGLMFGWEWYCICILQGTRKCFPMGDFLGICNCLVRDVVKFLTSSGACEASGVFSIVSRFVHFFVTTKR